MHINNPVCFLTAQVGRMGSALELSSISRFVPEPYGLEDDQRSMGFDESDYGLGNPLHFSTVPRNHHAFPQGPPRRAGYDLCVFEIGYLWRRDVFF